MAVADRPARAAAAAVAAAAAAALLAAPLGARAFKAHEFKKCADAGFCARHREREARAEGESYRLEAWRGAGAGTQAGALPAAVGVVPAAALDGATLRAWVVDSAGAKLALDVTPYDGGYARVRLDEAEQPRYQVPDVLAADLGAHAAAPAAGVVTTVADGSGRLVTIVPLPPSAGRSGNGRPCTLRLAHSPLVVELSCGGEALVTLNAANRLEFERTRAEPDPDRDEEGMWAETFRGHEDTKPHGPQAVAIDVEFPGAKHMYGIPEHATSLALKPTKRGVSGESLGEPYRLYNLDVFEYLADSPFGLYGSIPLLLAHSARGGTAGLFWFNAAEMFVDVHEPTDTGSSAHWMTESGVMDLFLFPGPDMDAVWRQYAQVTSPTSLPPLFAIAYHQCRWNYKDEADVAAVDAGFDEHDIPYDVLWLDIEHTNGKRYMTWDSRHFPSPRRMQEEIAAKRRRMVTIVDPHVKRDPGFPMHKEAMEKNLYVKDKAGKDFDGWCWPGSSSYLDVVSKEVRDWWATKFSFEDYVGSTSNLFIWNDMNEPSVFNGPEVTMQKDNLHWGGAVGDASSQVEHRDVHNAFGLYYHMATAEGLRRRSEGTQRPFVLSRAFFSGTQKVGPIWTGDNTADWDHLAVSIPMLTTLSLTGLPFSGADVGGFFNNPDAELLTRWYQLGTYYPFFRGHAHQETKRREPWLFGEPYTGHIRAAIRERYALLPYIYTLFWGAAKNGTGIMKPMWVEFPQDESTFALEDQFMIGSSIMVAPVLKAGVSAVTPVFPAGSTWYHFPSGEAFPRGWGRGGNTVRVNLGDVPVFYRAGAIVPRRERARRSSDAMTADPYTLIVCADDEDNAEGVLYLDDGSSYAFEQGAYALVRFSLTRESPTLLKLSGGVVDGTLDSELSIERIVLLGVGSVTKVALAGSGEELTSFSGPALMRTGVPANAVVIKKPDVRVTSSFGIDIEVKAS